VRWAVLSGNNSASVGTTGATGIAGASKVSADAEQYDDVPLDDCVLQGAVLMATVVAGITSGTSRYKILWYNCLYVCIKTSTENISCAKGVFWIIQLYNQYRGGVGRAQMAGPFWSCLIFNL